MTQLSDVSILKAMDFGRIKIDPWRNDLLQPASVDLTLGTSWLKPNTWFNYVRAKARDPQFDRIENDLYVIGPGKFVLATTRETVTLGNDVAAKFEGKSSLGRMGLMTHVTAGFIDPGFSGQITLEIHNVSPWDIGLDSGIKIGQLVFTNLDRPCSAPYGDPKWGSRYHGQTGATAVKI